MAAIISSMVKYRNEVTLMSRRIHSIICACLAEPVSRYSAGFSMSFLQDPAWLCDRPARWSISSTMHKYRETSEEDKRAGHEFPGLHYPIIFLSLSFSAACRAMESSQIMMRLPLITFRTAQSFMVATRSLISCVGGV